MNADEKITRARIQLQKSNPFFAFLLLHAKVKEATKGELPMPTIGVDAHGNMYYNAGFVSGLSEKELEGILCHEVLHVALEHLYRSEKMKHDQLISNVAADLVVNDILLESGFALPTGGCVPRNHSFTHPQFTVNKINEKCVEEIYDEILGQIPINKRGCSCGKGKGNKKGKGQGQGSCPNCGKSKSGNGVGDANTIDNHMVSDKGDGGSKGRKESKKWKKLVSEAGHYAKMRGELPAGLERRIGEIFESKLNWKQLLNHYITAAIPFDYTYSRPSNKSLSTGFYMPSIRKDNQLEIVVAIDTSGSIGQEELGTFLGEMIGIAKSYSSVKMRVIECDADIQHDVLVSNGNIKKIREMGVHGGGGTSHVPVYDYVKKKYPNTKILINFTDGYTAFPDQKRWGWNSIWILTKHSCDEDQIPFGKVVKIK